MSREEEEEERGGEDRFATRTQLTVDISLQQNRPEGAGHAMSPGQGHPKC